MMVPQQQISHKKPKKSAEKAPAEFIDDCKVLEPDFEKTKPKVLRIYKKWLDRGKKPKLIGKWLRDQLRQWYSPDGMVKLIPQEAHRIYVKDGSHSKKQSQSSANKFVKNTNLSTGSTHGSQKATEKVGSFRTEPLKTHEHAAPGKWNQDPDDYDIEHLEQYDIDYLREVVKHLHNMRLEFIDQGFKWQKRYDEMRLENGTLKQMLDKSRPMRSGGIA